MSPSYLIRAAQAAQHEQEVKGAEGEVEAAKEEHDKASKALKHARMASCSHLLASLWEACLRDLCAPLS